MRSCRADPPALMLKDVGRGHLKARRPGPGEAGMSASTDFLDAFSIEQDGGITLIEVAPSLERMDPSLIEDAAGLLLEPLRHQEAPRVVVDLGRIDYFG